MQVAQIESMGTLYESFVLSQLVHPGVIGFIVLSGYCIRLSVTPSVFDAKKFMLRRFFRIMPVYWAATLTAVLCSIFISQNLNVLDVLLRVLILSPFLPLRASLGNLPLDTVAVEFYLYIIYAIVLRFQLRYSLIGLIAAGIFFPPLLPSIEFDRVWSFTNILAFLPYWWLGVLAAEIKLNTSNARVVKIQHLINKDIAVGIALLAMILLTFSTTFFDRYSISGAGIRYLNQFLFSFIIVIILVRGYLSWHSKFLLKIGLASYALYAFHMPILILTETVFQSGFLIFWVGVIMSVMVALIMNLILEKPLHLMGKQITQNAKLINN